MELNHIYCGDCLEVMRGMGDNSVDLVLTDPPYGIGIAKKGTVGGQTGFKGTKLRQYGNQEWDNNIPSKEYFDEIIRISKNQVIFGGNYFVEYLTNSSCWIVWDKKEHDKSNFADCELAWTSFKTAVRKFTYGWVGLDMINNSKYDYRYHPTQKPIALINWILLNYSKKDDTILDPFLGSGTTCVAAKELGRRYIGIEISQKYVDIANKRLSQGVLPF